MIYSLVLLVPLGGVTALRVVTLFIMAGWSLQILVQGKAHLRISSLNKWLVVYGLMISLETMVAPHFFGAFFGAQGSFVGFITMANLLFIAFAALTFFQEKKHIQAMLKLSVWIAILSASILLIGGKTANFLPQFIVAIGLWMTTRRRSDKWILGLATIPLLLMTFGEISQWEDFIGSSEDFSLLSYATTLVGLGLLIRAGRLVVETMRDQKVNSHLRITAASFGAAGLAIIAQGFFSAWNLNDLLLLTLLVASSAALYHIAADPRPQSKQFKLIQFGRKSKVLMAITMVFTLALCGWFTFRQASAEWHFNRATSVHINGELKPMLDEYKAATSAMPWIMEYWRGYGRGAYYFSMRDAPVEVTETLLVTAIDAFTQATRLVPNDPWVASDLGSAHLSYATVLEKKGQTSKANESKERGVEYYRQAMEHAGGNPQFAYNYAMLLHPMGRLEESRDAFLKVLELSDIYEDTDIQLALIETELKDYEKARFYIQKALRSNPGNEEEIKILQNRVNSESAAQEL